MKSPEPEHKEWDDRRRHEYDNPRYAEESDPKIYNNVERPRDHEPSSYRGQRRFEEAEKMAAVRSGEMRHGATYYNT